MEQMSKAVDPLGFIPLKTGGVPSSIETVREWRPDAATIRWATDTAARLSTQSQTILLGILGRLLCVLNGQGVTLEIKGWNALPLGAPRSHDDQTAPLDDGNCLTLTDGVWHVADPNRDDLLPQLLSTASDQPSLRVEWRPTSTTQDGNRQQARQLNRLTTLIIAGDDSQWRLIWLADTARIDRDHVVHVAWQLETVLAALADGLALKQAFGRCRALEANRHDGDNPEDPVHPPSSTVLRRFEEHARYKPDRIAISQGTTTVTYAAARRIIEAWAEDLADAATDWVAIDARSDPWTVLLMLAAWKAGLGYVALDLEMPAALLQRIGEEFGGSLVLATAQESDVLPLGSIEGLKPLTLSRRPTPRPGRPKRQRPANPLAYVVYTSGSTGTPKGVCISHDSLARSTDARPAYYGAEPRRFLLLSPCFVDSAAAGIFWALTTAGELTVASAAQRRDSQEILRLVLRTQPSHLLCLPSLYQAVLQDLSIGTRLPLEVAIVAAEAVLPKVVQTHSARCSDVELYNEYGPSEGTIWATVHRCVPGQAMTVPIGRAAGHVTVSVLTSDGEACLVGEQGEIHLGDRGVGVGYWNRPAETAARFVPAAQAREPGARLYRTGDYSRRLPNGDLLFLGRKDGQVKLSGYRVELEAVRACLEAVDEVAEAYVGTVDTGAGPSLVAWVAMQPAVRMPPDLLLRSWLRKHLPVYMHPSAFVPVEQLPRLRSGKVAIADLPAPDAPGDEQTVRADPATPIEQLIAATWQELLGCGPIGRQDNFFELGGNSFRAIQATAYLRDALGTEAIGVHHLMDTPILAALAHTVDEVMRAEKPSAPKIVKTSIPIGEPIPATFFQQRLYMLQQLHPELAAYHCPFVLQLDDELDVDRLKTAYRRVIDRFPVLRTNFVIRQGEVHQIVTQQADAELTVDHHALSTDPDVADAKLLAEMERPFDLETDPLHRARLFRADGGWVLVLTLHHIVFDGWSIGLFARALGAYYTQPHRSDLERGDADRSVQFRDFAIWQHACWREGAWVGQLRYWQETLDGIEPFLNLPTDRPRPSEPRLRGETFHFHMEAGPSGRVNDACRRLGVTPFMFLESVFALVLGRYSGQSDILVGTALASRSQPETTTILGPLLNTVLLRNRLDDRLSFADLVRQTRRQVIAMHLNGDVSFEKVVEAVAPKRATGGALFLQAFFVLQEAEQQALDLGDVDWILEPHRSSFARFDLSISMVEETTGFAGQVEYDVDLFDRCTIDQIVRVFKFLAARAADAPEIPLWQLQSQPDETVRWMAPFEQGRGIGAPAVEPDGLAARIRHIAKVRPDAVAVSASGRHITYETLWRKATQAAQHLRRHGVREDSPVCILIPRSTTLPIVALGILIAGAGVLPLDIDAPAARVRTIWSAAGRPVIVHGQVDPDLLPAEATSLHADDLLHGTVAEATPLGRIAPESLAYVMFTSGSSGNPKGVMISHDAIINRLDWMQRHFGLKHGQRVLQKTPVTFDVCIWELFWPLREGGCLILAAHGEERDPDRLRKRLAGEQIEIVHFVPSMLSAFLRWQGSADLDALRDIVCSGEALTPEQVSNLRRQAAARITNLYGPTEAAIDATAWACGSADDTNSIPIGHPIDRVTCRVLDSRLARVALYAPGELYIGGVAVARGYLGQAALTAQAFQPDPYSDNCGARLYRTGDLVRLRSDGALLFLGRKDHQLKVRGIRLEPAEVEAVLSAYPSVDEAAVQLHPASTGMLVAHIATRNADLDLNDLRAHAGRYLPAVLVPGRFLPTTTLPRSSSGKISRKDLPAIGNSDSLSMPAPQSETERRLAILWDDLVPDLPLNLDQGFFANGGHSLLSIRLSEAIRAEFGVTLPLKALLGDGSFREIAGWIEDLAWLARQQPKENPVAMDGKGGSP